MATLNVGAGQAYETLSAAVGASHDGDTIAVQAGTYVNDFATISKDISIVGVGGMANFVATVAPPNGKGILVTQSDVTIENLSFSGAAVPDNNGAGIRYEGGNLVIIDSYFHDNQDGLLANSAPNGTIRIVGSEFANNGAGDGYSHNLYVNNIASLVIDDSYFHDADIGHQIKSRAQSTTITNSRIHDGDGTGSYSIDLPNGGVGVIQNNVIEQGAHSDNPVIIHYGGESAAYAGSSLLVEDNVVVNDMSGSSSVRLLNNATTVTATVSGNDVYGLTADQIASGSATVSDTTYLSTHPSLDTSAPWLDSGGSGTTFGAAGAANLAGTAGADTMAALAGNDEHVVNPVGDAVVDANGQGTDTVQSSVGHSLADNIENPTLTGSADINGTDDAPANVPVGNSGNNTLNSGLGADTMTGDAGNDTYVVDNVTEPSNMGTDLVQGLGDSVENLTPTGGANIDGTGNAPANELIGNLGNTILEGGPGPDTLTGLEGDDSFVFNTAPGATNVDTITDFNVANDTIQLDHATFAAISGMGTLEAAQFVANASGTAADRSGHTIHETDTGKLFCDSNGNAHGGATQFGQSNADLALTNSDFFII